MTKAETEQAKEHKHHHKHEKHEHEHEHWQKYGHHHEHHHHHEREHGHKHDHQHHHQECGEGHHHHSHESAKNANQKKMLLPVLVTGIMIGVVLALLLSPRRGKEIRHMISESGRQFLEAGKKGIEPAAKAEALVASLKDATRRLEEAV